MTTHCLLEIGLVEHLNYYSTHHSKALGGVFFEFQSVTRPFRGFKPQKVRVTLGNSEKTPPRAWTNVKILKTIRMTTAARVQLFLLLHFREGVRISKKKLQKPDEYKPKRRHNTDANRKQILVKAYTR